MAALNIADAITEAANQHGVDPDFALRIARAESQLNPAAVSPKGAIGVMQLMPKTASGLGVDPHDVRQNIIGGVKNLRQLQDKYGSDEQLVAAAYNAGSGAVDKHGGVPPYKETQDYVKKVIGVAPEKAAPTSELDKIFGVSRPAASAPATPAPTTAAAIPDQSALDKAFGVNRPARRPAGPALTASQANAQKAAKETVGGDWLVRNPDVYNVANALSFGTLPYLAGRKAAGMATIQADMARRGKAPPPTSTPADIEAATRQAYQGALEAHQTAHPFVSTAEQIIPLALSGVGRTIAKGTEAAASAAIPALAKTGIGRMAARLAGVGAAGAGYGAGTAASQGKTAPEIAQQAAITGAASVPFGLAGEGVAAAAPRVPASRVIVPALTTAVGAGAGTVIPGQTTAGGAMMGAAVGAGHALRSTNAAVEPTPAQRSRALGILAKNTTPETLESAHPQMTTVEAMGQSGKQIAKAAGAAGNPPKAITEAVNARQDAQAVHDRVSADLEKATGVAPDTAKMDADALVDAARKGPARTAYDAALTGKGVWTPRLAQLAAEPEVARAMDQARRLLGSEAFAPNPTAQTEAPFPPNMTSAELKARMTQAGKVKPGQEVSTNDLMDYLKKGGPTTYSLAPKNPEQIPTDKMWDLTKQMLEKGVKYDALGKPEPSSENHLQQHWTGQIRDATNEAIPGLKEARATSGEYLTFRQAKNNGEALWSSGKNAETAASFAKRYAGLSPAEQQATQMGYLAHAHTALERGKLNFTAAQSPYHRAIQRTMFGAAGAAQVQGVFAREVALEQSAREIHGHLKPQPAPEPTHGGIAQGMMIAAADHGLSPSALGHGALAGVVGRGTSALIRAAGGQNIHPGVRNALGEIGAQPASVTAAQIRAQAKSNAETTLAALIAEDLNRGFSIGAAQPATHALRGLTSVSREDKRAAP